MPDTKPTKEAMEAAQIECNHGQTNRICRSCIATTLDAYAAERIEDATDGDRTFTRLAQVERERDAALAKLEAAEAQVARLNAQIVHLSSAWSDDWDCSASPGHDEMNEAFAQVARDAWPADLLEAVRLVMFLPNGQERHGGRIEGGCEWDVSGKCDCYTGKARAVLVRYGLLKEAR